MKKRTKKLAYALFSEFTIKYMTKMASQERFELPTHALEGRCSIQLSYWDLLFLVTFFIIISQKLKVNTLILKNFLSKEEYAFPPLIRVNWGKETDGPTLLFLLDLCHTLSIDRHFLKYLK